MNRILVATDGSPPSAEAGVVAIELASKQRSELSFVHVVPRLDVFSAGAYTAALPHEPTERDQALLEDAAAVAAEHGIVATTALRYGVTVEDHRVRGLTQRRPDRGRFARTRSPRQRPSRQRLAWRPARVEAPGPDRARGGRRPRSGPDTSRPKCSIIFGNGITLCGEVTGHAPVRMAGDVT